MEDRAEERSEADAALAGLPPRDLALRTLASSAEYMGRVETALAQTGELLRSGRTEEANHLYADVLDALTVLIHTLDAAQQVLGPGGAALGALGEGLGPWLTALTEAQSQGDWLRVADYLEYELAPLVARTREAITAIERAAND